MWEVLIYTVSKEFFDHLSWLISGASKPFKQRAIFVPFKF